MDSWEQEFGAAAPKNLGSLLGEVVDAQSARTMSANQRAATAWYRANGDRERARAARDAAYYFMSTMAGDLPDFEEASRALFAADRRKFGELIAGWPTDIRDHVIRLAFADRT